MFFLTQVRDLLSESSSTVPKVRMGVQESFVELVQEKVENPLEFSAALKIALQNRSVNSPKAMVSHLYAKHFLFCFCRILFFGWNYSGLDTSLNICISMQKV